MDGCVIITIRIMIIILFNFLSGSVRKQKKNKNSKERRKTNVFLAIRIRKDLKFQMHRKHQSSQASLVLDREDGVSSSKQTPPPAVDRTPV